MVFACTGTEAVEIALRMARFATGRLGIIATNATYHGNSELVGALDPHRRWPAGQSRICARSPLPETYLAADPWREPEAELAVRPSWPAWLKPSRNLRRAARAWRR